MSYSLWVVFTDARVEQDNRMGHGLWVLDSKRKRSVAFQL